MNVLKSVARTQRVNELTAIKFFLLQSIYIFSEIV